MKNPLQPLGLCALFIAMALTTSAQITVDATAGTTTGSYTTLKEAFDSINTGYHQGVIDIEITGSTTESASAILRRSGTGLASYSSVHISPSAVVTISGNINGSLIHLKGTNNVTIDGRIGATGSNALTLINNSALTNTAVVQLSSLGSGLGAASNTVSYCNIKAGAFAGLINTFGIYIADSTISNTATGLNNNYNSIVGNVIQKCRYGIYNRGSSTSSAVYNKSLVISSNKIGSLVDSLTVSFIGIDCRNNDSLTVQKNEINGMLETNQTAIVRAIELGGNIINSNILENYINQIRNTTTTLFRSGQGIVISTVAASNNTIANNIISNLNGHGSGTFTNNVWGIFVNAGGGIKILFNTVALTGTGTTTGSADRSGCLLLNSAASTAIEVRGNILYNTRFPGNNASGFSEGIHSLTTAVNLTINNNIYYVVPSNVRYIVGVLAGDRTNLAAWQTATTQDANSLDGNPFIATNMQCIPGPSSPAIGAGPTSTGILTDFAGTTRGVAPTIGAHENAVSIVDLQPTKIYTLGKLPIPYSNPHTLRASIVNQGNDTAFASKAYISVQGVNSIYDSLIISPIAPGTFITVDMPAYSYLNTGVDTVMVSVENDANNSNNNSTPLIQLINTNTYSYAEPFLPAAGGVGFNGATGDFVAKFPYTGSNSINQIGVNFSAGGQTLSVGIWDTSATGTPGANLWTSTPFTTTAGLNTIVVNPPIPITGSFYVGVRQTGTVNASFSYQSESPIRPGTFYFTSPTGGTTWNDFSPNNPFRFMIEPRLQDADDIGPESVIQPCQRVLLGSTAFSPEIKVLNYGLNTRDTFSISYEITGPVNSSGSGNFGGVGLLTSQSTILTLPTTFNPTTAGVYTIKVWTQILDATDLSTGNDTMTSTFEVVDLNTSMNGGNQLTFNGTNQYGTVDGNGSLNVTGTMLTLEAWVKQTLVGGERYIISKNNDASPSGYSLHLNAAGNIVFLLTTINGVDSLVSSTTLTFGIFNHVAATYNGIAGEARIYINGEERGFKSMYLSIVGNPAPFYIGRGKDGSYLAGSLNEVKVWDTTRTTDQIRMGLHTRLSNIAHANLLGYWRMDESTGNYIADASGNCHTAFLTNGGTFATSEIELGTPQIYYESVAFSGAFGFTGSNMSAMVYNQIGNNEYYAHKFSGLPSGTSPSFVPGTVTNVHNNSWIVYRYGSGTMDSTEITFYTNGITLAANPADIILFKRSSGTLAGWTQTSLASTLDPNAGLVTFRVFGSDLNNQFSIGANNNTLPVQLLSLKATRNGEHANITWATASEIDNLGFDVQRSTDGKTFTTIGFVKGNGTKATLSGYAYSDENIFKTGITRVYYRLLQKDMNGKATYSSIVTLAAEDQRMVADNIFPNPFSTGLYIETAAQAGSMMIVKISNLQGQVVHESRYTIQTSGLVDVGDLGNLPKGIYFIHTQTELGASALKVVKN